GRSAGSRRNLPAFRLMLALHDKHQGPRQAMTCRERDQRQYHALREHIDSLLARGASLVGRDPVRLSLEGRTFTVQHGMLVGSENPQDLLETFAESPKSQARHRE